MGAVGITGDQRKQMPVCDKWALRGRDTTVCVYAVCKTKRVVIIPDVLHSLDFGFSCVMLNHNVWLFLEVFVRPTCRCCSKDELNLYLEQATTF